MSCRRPWTALDFAMPPNVAPGTGKLGAPAPDDDLIERDGGQMDRLQSMRVYAHVADAGSFTAAANSLGWSTGAVSRTNADLETHLRTRLINRTTRRLALSSAGDRYLERCRSILAAVDHA